MSFKQFILFNYNLYNYRPQPTCERNVFTGVDRLSTGGMGDGGICLSACWDAPIPHPPGADTPD